MLSHHLRWAGWQQAAVVLVLQQVQDQASVQKCQLVMAGWVQGPRWVGCHLGWTAMTGEAIAPARPQQQHNGQGSLQSWGLPTSWQSNLPVKLSPAVGSWQLSCPGAAFRRAK
jgi:hypothetical protein